MWPGMDTDGCSDLENINLLNIGVGLKVSKEFVPERNGFLIIISISNDNLIIVRAFPDALKVFSCLGNHFI